MGAQRFKARAPLENVEKQMKTFATVLGAAAALFLAGCATDGEYGVGVGTGYGYGYDDYGYGYDYGYAPSFGFGYYDSWPGYRGNYWRGRHDGHNGGGNWHGGGGGGGSGGGGGGSGGGGGGSNAGSGGSSGGDADLGRRLRPLPHR